VATSRVALTRPRKIASGGLGLIHLALAYAYTQPVLSQAPTPPGADRVSIVAYINALGPVWLIGFGITGAGLIAALTAYPRALSWAHTAGVAVATTYSTAIWVGFALSASRPTIISAVLSVTVVLWHVSMSDLYSGTDGVQRRRHAA
jgi:hypothetical protein